MPEIGVSESVIFSVQIFRHRRDCVGGRETTETGAGDTGHKEVSVPGGATLRVMVQSVSFVGSGLGPCVWCLGRGQGSSVPSRVAPTGGSSREWRIGVGVSCSRIWWRGRSIKVQRVSSFDDGRYGEGSSLKGSSHWQGDCGGLGVVSAATVGVPVSGIG